MPRRARRGYNDRRRDELSLDLVERIVIKKASAPLPLRRRGSFGWVFLGGVSTRTSPYGERILYQHMLTANVTIATLRAFPPGLSSLA